MLLVCVICFDANTGCDVGLCFAVGLLDVFVLYYVVYFGFTGWNLVGCLLVFGSFILAICLGFVFVVICLVRICMFCIDFMVCDVWLILFCVKFLICVSASCFVCLDCLLW